MTAIVTRGNAADLHLPDESVDLVVTSPPYHQLRAYQDGGEAYAGQIGAEKTTEQYLDALIACTAEWMRVLKPGGSIFVNLGDSYTGSGRGGNGTAANASGYRAERATGYRRQLVSEGPRKSLRGIPWRYALRCTDELGLTLRADVIWSKPSGLPDNAADRAGRRHEYMFHFTKSATYFHDADRQESTCVWSIATQPLSVPADLGLSHIAAFPIELVRRPVLSHSPPGGVVLDPFAGSGTTMLVASVLGRVGIGTDLSLDYCRLAQWRTTDPGERARVLGVAKPEPVVEGQLGMFEGLGA